MDFTIIKFDYLTFFNFMSYTIYNKKAIFWWAKEPQVPHVVPALTDLLITVRLNTSPGLQKCISNEYHRPSSFLHHVVNNFSYFHTWLFPPWLFKVDSPSGIPSAIKH